MEIEGWERRPEGKVLATQQEALDVWVPELCFAFSMVCCFWLVFVFRIQ